MIILENISLKPFTTFKIGGKAKFFSTITNLKELEKILNFIEKTNNRFFILGGGSNILISDEGFDGLIIKPCFEIFNIFENGEIVIGSGCQMPKIVNELSRLGYQGLEWAGGLPGEIGGAVRGNAGCFGYEIKNFVEEVLAINLLTKELKRFNNNECQFSYRSSFFKNNKEWLIIEIKLKLNPNFDSNELLRIMNEKINYRREKHPLEFPNAGSIFKNINLTEAPEKLKYLAEKYRVIKGDKIPTAFVIEYLGLKGKQIGGARISEKHANFIVNINNAKSKDVLDLINLIKDKVKDKFDLDLELEIELVN